LTTQAVVVGGHTLTGDILNLQWGGEDLTGVMTAEIIAISEANEWGGDFEVKDAVDINVGGDDVFNGYVEDVEPYRHPDYVDLPCVKIKCINDGRDLVKQYIDEEYQDTKLDDLVEDALGKITTSITYTSPNSAPTVSRTFKKGFLAREFRELCEEQNYSFYVANDHVFHLFPVGDSDEYLDGNGGRADVDLDSIANNSNNIIQFRKGERRGSTLYNYVEVMSGYLDDHWTEENPSDFTGTNCTPSIETSTYLAGRSAIKVTRNNGTGIIILDLDINNGGDGRYEYTALDFSKKSVGWYLMRPNCTMTGGNRAIRFRLTDDAGTIIQYIRGYHDLNPRSNLNATDRLDNDEWTRVEFPYGLATTINSSGSNNEGWQYVSGSNFDWEHVYKLSWRGFGNVQENDYFILDGLRLPSIEVKCIKQDATSISANGKRMLPKRRVDIKSQVELDTIATSMIEKYKNPMQTLKLTVIGNTDILYPGQSLDVNAPPYGIASDTKYRIQSVKHIVSLKACLLYTSPSPRD